MYIALPPAAAGVRGLAGGPGRGRLEDGKSGRSGGRSQDVVGGRSRLVLTGQSGRARPVDARRIRTCDSHGKRHHRGRLNAMERPRNSPWMFASQRGDISPILKKSAERNEFGNSRVISEMANHAIPSTRANPGNVRAALPGRFYIPTYEEAKSQNPHCKAQSRRAPGAARFAAPSTATGHDQARGKERENAGRHRAGRGSAQVQAR